MDINQAVASYQRLNRRILDYEEAAALMHWDLQTGAPEKAVHGRAGVIGTISTEAFKMFTSKEMEDYLMLLSNPVVLQQLDRVTQVSVREDQRRFSRYIKIPPEKFEAYIILTTQAEAAWKEAKHKGNFELFQPYLEQIVDYLHEAVELWGYEGHKYNTLLDEFEPGMTTVQLDEIFSSLKVKLVNLLERIKETGYVPDNAMFRGNFEKDGQRQLNLRMLEKMQFDFKRGRLDESVHPFTLKLNPQDVRITTSFDTKMLTGALFATIHEGGHALYEQNIRADLAGTPLCSASSYGIHESQSRYWENVVARSKPFWAMFYRDLVEIFPGRFEGIDIADIYRGINRVEPSLIRIQADELTYGLHIILRYELEKALIGGEIKVSALPELWNENMKAYLGVIPEHHGEGVLQDVHWSRGYFGYFPSYTLGNIYASQFVHCMKQEIPDYEESIETGNFSCINEWLKEKIHQHGKLFKPAELVHMITGEEINPQYFIDYLEGKYGEIYNF